MTGSTTRIHVCVVSPYSYPLFNKACISPFGGSEVRLSLIAKELATYPDLEVSLIVFDHGQPPVERRDGVTIYAWPGKYCPVLPDDPVGLEQVRSGAVPDADVSSEISGDGSGQPLRRSGRRSLFSRFRLAVKTHLPYSIFPILRRLRPPMSLLASAVHTAFARVGGKPPFGYIRGHAVRRADVGIYDRVGADVYVARSNNDLAGHLTCYCNRLGKKVVLVSGSDYDFVPLRRLESGSTDLYGSMTDLMEYAIQAADLVVVQNEQQAGSAKTHFGRDTVILPSPVDLETACPRAESPDYMLWVGKSDDRVKRPEIFLDLVEKLPGHRSVMVLNMCIDSVHRRILRRARTVEGLTLVTYVPFDEMEKYFAGARLLVNTSVFEGFPNTFLQAAKYGVPIVSLAVDPEGMLSRHGCGVDCGGDFEKFARSVALFMSDDGPAAAAGMRCRAYVAGHHDRSAVVRTFREHLLRLVGGQ